MVYCFLILFLWSSSVFATPGVVVETKGKVELTLPGENPKPAAVGIEFPDGAKFTAGPSSKAVLMFMDGVMETVIEKSEVVIDGGRKNSTKKLVGRQMLAALDEAVRATGNGPTVHGMVKMAPPSVGELKVIPPVGGIYGVYPRETAIQLNKQIRFQWQVESLEGNNLAVVVFESGKPHRGFAIGPAGRQKNVSAKELKLKKGGNYNWYIGEKQGKQYIAKSQRFTFSILSAADEKRLVAELKQIDALGLATNEGKNFLKAQTYFPFKMYDAMVTLLEPLYQKNPTPAVQKLLFLAYVKMGRLDVAKRYQ